MGGCGGCDTPPENKLSANEGICRQTKNNIPQNVKLNRDISRLVLKISRIKMVLYAWISATPPPPKFVGQTKQVGQYSLHSRAILAYNKEKWDKFCQFCEKLCYFVISGKFVLCLEKLWYVRKIFGPLKWYTDRNFFGDGGGEVVKNNFLRH